MMRTVLALILPAMLTFCLTAASQAPMPAPGNLTLAQAVSIALEKNPTVHAADAYSKAVHEGIAEARAARMPRNLSDSPPASTSGSKPAWVTGNFS